MRPQRIFVVVALWLGVQLAIPIWQLIREPMPSRFSWQMYAKSPRPPRMAGVEADGTRVPLPIGRYLYVRYDMNPERYVPALAAHICGLMPSLVAIEATRGQARGAETYPCSRLSSTP
jgi:hypothetical protein